MKEFAKILYGSQNYGLAGPDSDKDYKLLLCPTFEDLYNYHKVDKHDVPSKYDEHYSPMSIMQFNRLLLDGNPNCLEMLFSLESESNVPQMLPYVEMARGLFKRRYIALVWDRFYSALQGIALNSIDHNGISGKTVSRACYFYGLMEYIAQTGFVIDEKTWRHMSPNFHGYTQDIRFGDHTIYYLEFLANQTRDNFAGAKQHMHDAAQAYINRHPEAVRELQNDAQRLENYVQAIVAQSIWEELNPCFSH